MLCPEKLTTYCFKSGQVNELTARLIGMAFTSANIFDTDLPQPLTLNPWQLTSMLDFPLKSKQAVVIENNGVFALLHQEHPDWPLILQSGNDFNEVYVQLIQRLEARGMRYVYLGDLDSAGIQMADQFARLLKQTQAEEVAALQQPTDVRLWLADLGKIDARRTKQRKVVSPVYQAEMTTIALFGKFIEQEQLMGFMRNGLLSGLKRQKFDEKLFDKGPIHIRRNYGYLHNQKLSSRNAGKLASLSRLGLYAKFVSRRNHG